MYKFTKDEFFEKKSLTSGKISSTMFVNNKGISVPIRMNLLFFERRYIMNWDGFREVWDEFLWFMDRVMQWLMYIFGATDKWPPDDYPNIDDTTSEA